MVGRIKGMESVVASVSGYHGTERFNLIKLISQSGASYVGNMSPSTTHLVCWKFEGRKYDLAKKFRITIVNHRWVEECIKQGKRVPEQPFTLQSGQELGPLSLEVPLISEVCASNKSGEVLKDQSNLYDCSDVKVTALDDEGSGLAVWTDSILLNENIFPEFGQTNSNAHRLKPKPLKKSSKLGDRPSRGYCFQEPPLSGFVRMHEEPSSCSWIHSMKGKRKILENEGSKACTVMHTVRERRKNSKAHGSTAQANERNKLVKKNAGKEVLDSVNLDSDEDDDTIRLYGCHDNVAALSIHPDGEATFVTRLNKHSRVINLGSGDIEEIEDWNNLSASKANLRAKSAQAALNETKNGNNSKEENLDREIKDMDQTEHTNRFPMSMELSCVICWTEFSSTRGVLACGHRFCYSCIQNWADHMASRRQISTCPLCKAPFMGITKVEDAATSDQKIYSQTIPCASTTTDILFLTEQERPNFGPQSLLAPACSECRSREPVDLLISCQLCQIRCIHSYCLDPPLFPWTCIHCKDLQILYQHTR